MNANKELAIGTMWTFLAKYGQQANPNALVLSETWDRIKEMEGVT